MLMMFSASIRRLPLDKAMPYNDDDMILIMEPTIAIRLVNIRSGKDEPFSIRFLMEKKEVFACDDFKIRIENFADVLDTRIERYFITNKTDYIFFDREEQNQIQEVFDKSPGVNCAIDIYVITDNGEFEKVDLAEMNASLSRKVVTHLNTLRVRGVLNVRDYRDFVTHSHTKTEEAKQKFEERNDNIIKNKMSVYFKRYSKLKELDTKDKVLRYFKLLLKKYHPDANRDNIEESEAMFKIINEDLQAIKNSLWFDKLD